MRRRNVASSVPLSASPSTSSHSASISHANNTGVDARVAILLNGEQVKFNSSFTSSGKLGGTLASLTLHDHILRFILERKGRASQALVLLFGSKERMSYEMGEEKATQFVQSYNTTEGFASAFIDVGAKNGAAAEAMCTHLPFHLASGDYLILGSFTAEHTSGDSKLESTLRKLAQGDNSHKIAFLGLNERAEATARDMGLGVVSIGDVLKARTGEDAHLPALSQLARASSDALVSQIPSAISDDSSDWTPPPSSYLSQYGPDAEWGDPRASSNSRAGPSAPPSPGMRTRPATFAKARSGAAPTLRPLIPVPPSPSIHSNPVSSISQSRRDSPWTFFPLTKLLHEQAAAGFPRPLRSQIGGLLTKRKNGRHALNKFGGFKEYTKAAERNGLVEMGTESFGKDWIALKEGGSG